MGAYYEIDPWSIVESGWNPDMQEASESIFSLGNGSMGQRANFEERYSGPGLQGSYLAGIYYPDRTRVGWWKNGYPEYFAKVLNAPSWIGIGIKIDGEELDLNRQKPENFRRELHMKQGCLERSFIIAVQGGKLFVTVTRFLSMAREEVGAIRYALRSEGFRGRITFEPGLCGEVKNRDANYGETFWEQVEARAWEGGAQLQASTKKTGFRCCLSMGYVLLKNQVGVRADPEIIERDGYVANRISVDISGEEEVVLYKYASVLTSLNHLPGHMPEKGISILEEAMNEKFDQLLKKHVIAWEQKWEHSDIVIEGDPVAQQAIRFNIFQLNQTYTGKDARLNIGPKGFTGEKYGGSTYWDTEAFMLPFYLSTAPGEVSKNLLIYRYNHLSKAIENAEKLGFSRGAALYPMVTMNGEECHNEWEITFEEIHRNGAIAYAIYNYIRYTGDDSYMASHGLEVLIALSRFWKQRVNWSEEKNAYVILGVTGPNEYENNVNNNWYTNRVAQWTLRYTLAALGKLNAEDPEAHARVLERTGCLEEESRVWKEIADTLYFSTHGDQGVFLQQDGYMDKEQRTARELDPSERPLNQHWSWDRILRSCFIKQADVLQGLFFFEDEFDKETLEKNYDFYEPRTVHESSLSPCVHSILAARLGRSGEAYELYLRTARLDLDDYNNEVAEGLHITSMGGTWMSVVYGFGGMKVKNGVLSFSPLLPGSWSSLSFNILFRERTLNIEIRKNRIRLTLVTGEAMEVEINGKRTLLATGKRYVAD